MFWVGFNYVRTIRFYLPLSYTSTAALTFLSLIYSKRGLHNFFSRLTTTRRSLGIRTTSRTIRYKSMTSANGGTYAEKYPCDGWVDNLEPTLLLPVFFLIQGHNPNSTTNLRECVNTRGCHPHEEGLVEQGSAMRRPVSRRNVQLSKCVSLLFMCRRKERKSKKGRSEKGVARCGYITSMPRATKHYASYAYRKILQIIPYSTMAITLLPTIEHI